MRHPTSEKVEIIRLVEQSHLPVRRTLEMTGVPRATFYRWYDLYQTGGPEALQASGLERVAVVHRPRLLSDNGPCYVSGELAQWICPRRVVRARC